MTSNLNTSNVDDIAAEWVVRMDKAEWSEEEESELQMWLNEDARHRGALLQAEATWIALEKCGSAIPRSNYLSRHLMRRRNVVAFGGAALAASFAGSVVLFNRPQVFQTDVGEIRRVALNDGSIATINTQSRIDVKLTEHDRRVRLDRGEAWFQVARDHSRPFIVESGQARARAVGTAFSVRRTDSGSEILVTEGTVEAWAGTNSIILKGGQRAFFADKAPARIDAIPNIAIERSLAWRRGKIDLEGSTLTDAVAEFNRYNRRKLRLIDPALGNEQFDGSFDVEDIEGFANAVKNSLNVPVDSENPDEIRIGKALIS